MTPIIYNASWHDAVISLQHFPPIAVYLIFRYYWIGQYGTQKNIFIYIRGLMC